MGLDSISSKPTLGDASVGAHNANHQGIADEGSLPRVQMAIFPVQSGGIDSTRSSHVLIR